VSARVTVVLLSVACGGTLSLPSGDAATDSPPDVALDSGTSCDPPPACANAAVIAGPVPLDGLVDESGLASVVTTDCGYAFLTLQKDVVSALPLSRSGTSFTTGTAYTVATGVDSVLPARSLRDTLFMHIDAQTLHVFGPALGNASAAIVLPADVPPYLIWYVAHEDRLLFLFVESPGNETATLDWIELARDGTITHALEPAPNGMASHGYNAFFPGLVSYANGFAWFVPQDPQGHGTIFFSKSTGEVSQAAPTGAIDFVPLTSWPYGPGVAFSSSPSVVMLDDGQVGATLTRHASLFYSSDSSPELGIVDASRESFSQVDANGNASQVTYDGGKILDVETFQPAPLLAIRGGEAVLANPEGNLVAIGCTP
jgi:hypothetical protein